MTHTLRSVELYLVRLPLVRAFTTSSHTKTLGSSEHLVVEDSQVKIEETRVRGVTRLRRCSISGCQSRCGSVR